MAETDKLTEAIANEIAAIKLSMTDPIFVVCGDMNGRDLSRAFVIDDNIGLLNTAPTKGVSTLDLVLTNVLPLVTESWMGLTGLLARTRISWLKISTKR